MTLLKIASGAVYDPKSNVNGVVQDVWVRDGKAVAPPTDRDGRPDKVFDPADLPIDVFRKLDSDGRANQ